MGSTSWDPSATRAGASTVSSVVYDLDHLKASVSFRGWGQKDPLVEFKKECFETFVSLMADLRKAVAQFFFRVQFDVQQQQPRRPAARGADGRGARSG